MNESDILFLDYTESSDYGADNYDKFSHFGWEGTGIFALWKFADAYYQGGECLFEKFKNSKGNIYVLDGLGLPICFMYRHYVELTIKALYLKFASQTEDDYKAILNKGHDLLELWHETKPTLKKLRDRVGSTISLGVLESYIKQLHNFDQSSMIVRYPLDKKLKQTNKDRRLDIYNLHDRMVELHDAFEKISFDLDNQIEDDVNPYLVQKFKTHYASMRADVDIYLKKIEPYTQDEIRSTNKKEINFFDLDSSIAEQLRIRQSLYESMSDDLLILLDVLYYVGDFIINGSLRLPKYAPNAAEDAIKQCIINMQNSNLEFGKPKNDEINFYSNQYFTICRNICKSIEVIDAM